MALLQAREGGLAVRAGASPESWFKFCPSVPFDIIVGPRHSLRWIQLLMLQIREEQGFELCFLGYQDHQKKVEARNMNLH